MQQVEMERLFSLCEILESWKTDFPKSEVTGSQNGAPRVSPLRPAGLLLHTSVGEILIGFKTAPAAA
jgi:hypothetical protein